MTCGNFSKINDSIYIGGAPLTSEFVDLKMKGIGFVINLQKGERPNEEQVVKEAELRYFAQPLTDYHPPDLKQLETVVAEIQKAIGSGMKVFIHCGVGHGRSTNKRVIRYKKELQHNKLA